MRELFETLLDTTSRTVDNAVHETWFEQYTKGSYKKTLTKNDTYKIKGTLVIQNLKKDKLPDWLRISEVSGAIFIQKCDIKTIDGLFDDKVILHASVTIASCPYLESLVGLPKHIDGDLTISGCPKIKSSKDIPYVSGDLTLAKLGRRFDDLKQNPTRYGHLFCSEQEIEATLLEAVQDPVLMRLWRAAQKFERYGERMYKDLKSVFAGMEIKYDEIMPDCCMPFRRDQIPSKLCQSMIKDVIYSQKKYSFIIACDDAGNPLAVFTYNRNVIPVYDIGKYTQDERFTSPILNIRYKGSNKYQELASKLKDSLIGRLYIYVPEGDVDNWNLRRERHDSKQGMILYTDEYFDNVRRANRERYRKLVDQIKASRDNNAIEYAKKASALMQRYDKLTMAMLSSNPPCPGYKFTNITDLIRNHRTFNRGHEFGQDGLMYIMQNYITTIQDAKKGESYYGSFDNMKKSYENRLDHIIQRIDDELKALGF